MTTFPGSPRTLRGAIVAVDPKGPLSRVVVFQYNPDSLSRTVQPRDSGGGERAADTRRISGAPQETLSLTVEVDATDQLESGDPVAASFGVLPQLSVLEMLLNAGSATVIANTALMLAGSIEILPVELPLALLVYGPTRVVPVRITQLSITEQAHSPALAPIRASVEVSAAVLAYSDLPTTELGHALAVAHLVKTEVLATQAAAFGMGSAIADLVGG